ncbi:MAG: hypothetical protein ACRCYX_07115 [Dermatophilaceae bacterium]
MTQWDLVSDEFVEASKAADGAPAGPDRVRAHESCLDLAQRHGSFAEEFIARLDLTEALDDVPDDPAGLTHVAWLHAALAGEHSLTQDDRDAVLWRLKWAVDLTADLPGMPLTAVSAAIDTLETALRTDGYHLRPVHAARAWLARCVGDAPGIGRELSAWMTEPRDSQSDCEACELREQAHLVLDTDPRQALEVLEPVTRGHLVCGDEPHSSLGVDAELRLELGDVDGAVASLRTAWYLAQNDPMASRTVAACLRALLRLGNTERAVDRLLPRLAWLTQLPTATDRMWFAGTAAMVLRRAVEQDLAPAEVDGRPVADAADQLAGTAADLAAAFDTRYGSTVVSEDLSSRLRTDTLPDRPMLPPTRLPASVLDAPGPPGAAAVAALVAPTTPVVVRADTVSHALLDLDDTIDGQLEAWRRDRRRLLPVSTSAEWAAVSLLDRVAGGDLPPAGRRELLHAARDAAHRSGDPSVLVRAEAEIALEEGDPASALVAVDRLESAGEHVEAAELLRRMANARGAQRPWELLIRAAAGYARAGADRRVGLCHLEAATSGLTRLDASAVAAHLDAAERHAGTHPELTAMVLHARARVARAGGRGDAALGHLRSAAALRDVPSRTRAGILLSLGDHLVAGAKWAELERTAADALAATAGAGHPVLLAVAQRQLGLAYVETGRPVEGVELLEAALPTLRGTYPGLVGPVGWALGNALVALGRNAEARSAFADAAVAFEADDRPSEAAHAQWRAGTAAVDEGLPDAATAHFDAAVGLARASDTVSVVVEVYRARAALRAAGGDLAGGLADLDAAIAHGQRLADQITAAGRPLPPGEVEFDGEVLEPLVLRQGAHLLAAHGQTDAAIARLSRAEALVGADLEVVLRAESAMFLADAGRLAEAEPRLRASLAELREHGISDVRMRAAHALARLLDGAGRGEDADEVWHDHGPSAGA